MTDQLAYYNLLVFIRIEDTLSASRHGIWGLVAHGNITILSFSVTFLEFLGSWVEEKILQNTLHVLTIAFTDLFWNWSAMEVELLEQPQLHLMS